MRETHARRITLTAWAASITFHTAMALYIASSTAAPDLGFDFALPTEVEFGLTEAVVVERQVVASVPAPPVPPAEAPSAPPEGHEANTLAPDGGVEEEPAEQPPAPIPEEAESPSETDPPASEELPASEEERRVAFLPAGSQIALRLNLQLIRSSPLAPDIRELLAVIPDWAALLGDAGIDPLDDLDQLLVASPNLQRSRLIIAGRAVGGEAAVREAAARLAAQRGEALRWREAIGVPITDWFAPDPTPRIVAVIDEAHFVICRRQDLETVLALAHLRQEDAAQNAAEALLATAPNEGFNLQIEGARNFARARRRRRAPLEMIPTRLQMHVENASEEEIRVHTRWHYESETEASTATAYWNRLRAAYARNVIVQVLGLGPLLQGAELTPQDSHANGGVALSHGNFRRLLHLARNALRDRARARAAANAPVPTVAPPEPPSSAVPRALDEPIPIPPSPY